MLLTMGTTGLAMDRLGIPRSIIWSFAEFQGDRYVARQSHCARTKED
jgi:hypothetical protein